LGPGLLQEPPEELLALRRDPVHVLAAPDLLLVEDPFDGALALEPPDGRVERAVGDAPESAERVGQPLGELVAVHGPLLQQAEDRELEHPVRSLRVASRYIDRLYRPDISNHYVVTASTRSGAGCGRRPAASASAAAATPAAPQASQSASGLSAYTDVPSTGPSIQAIPNIEP